MEHRKVSPKETALRPDSPCGSPFLVIIFRTGALRPSLWRKPSWKVVPGKCVYTLSLMYICAEYNKQSLWSSPNLLNLIAYQKILSSIRFSY